MEIERVERILKLWFDVERQYKTILMVNYSVLGVLWFDVERQYKTINGHCSLIGFLLWFDVERQYKTMRAP